MLPSATTELQSVRIDNSVVDDALVTNATLDHLLRLKAVEMAVYFFHGKSPTTSQFHEIYSTIHKFYTNEQSNKELHQRSVSDEER
jgi:hemolysin activation/secretion protein